MLFTTCVENEMFHSFSAPTSAPTLRPTSPPTAYDCDFENENTCTWIQVSADGDDFDWEISKGATDTFGTGPPADHTLQSKNGETRVNILGVFRQMANLGPIISHQMKVFFWA